jgi:hypothetical protein
MTKRGPAPGSGKSGGAAVGKRGGRPRLQVSCAIIADDLKTLKALALAAGVSIEDKARVLLANAIAEEWARYDAEISQAAESAWEGEIL